MKKLSFVWKINGGLLLVFLCGTLFAVASLRAQNESVNATKLLASALEQQLVTREIQVDFKKQVQEWKNILLRGDSTEKLEKYRSLFLDQEKAVVDNLDRLRFLANSATPDAVKMDYIERFSNAVSVLSADYEQAFEIYTKAPLVNQRAADQWVEGRDRAPNDLLESLVSAYEIEIENIYSNQIRTNIEKSSTLMTVELIVFFSMMALFLIVLNLRLVRPLKLIIRAALQLSEDNINLKLPSRDRGDEVGELARALETFRRKRITSLALQRSAELAIEEREQVKQKVFQDELARERAASEERELMHANELDEQAGKREQQLRSRIQRLSKAVHAAAKGNLRYLGAHPESAAGPDDDLAAMTTDLEKLFGQLDQDFSSISKEADTLNQAAAHLSDLGRSINDGAQLNTEQTEQVLDGAATVKEAMLQVASNVQQMDAGIRGIAGSAEKASGVATHAVELARSTDITMRQLSVSSTDIGNVIKLITSVAEQTNLLALNATIEAARAGDAGKGFAVVANEVKELAKETNKATDEIERRISTIRSDTDKAVEAIGSINSIVSEIDGIQSSISEAVQEQSDAAQFITELVEKTRGDNRTVRELVIEVAERQQVAQSSAADVQKASDQLRQSAEGNIELTARYSA